MKIHFGKLIPLLTLFSLLALAACGTNSSLTPSSTSSSQSFSNIPLGQGNNPEPGTDGKPRPSSTGHVESIIAAQGRTYAGSDNGKLYAFDAATGKLLWQATLGSSADLFAVADGRVYAGADNALYAFDANTGARLWRYLAGQGISQLQVAASAVYINTAANSDTSTLYALRATDGSQLWKYALHTTMPSLLYVGASTVYALQSQGISGNPDFAQTVYALRATDAHVLWQAALKNSDGMADNSGIEAGGGFYITTNHGAVYTFQATTGALLWHYARSAGDNFPIAAAPLVVNGVVYAGSSQGLAAFRIKDGVQLWWDKEKGSNPSISQPVISGNVIYFGCFDGTILAAHVDTGTRAWQHSGLCGPGLLAVASDLVISTSGPVSALHVSDGSLAWQSPVTVPGEFSGAAPSSAVAAGQVYIGSDDGTVHALRVNDGKQIWKYALQELAVSTPPAYSAAINFASSVAYQQALLIVSNLGLKPFTFCGSAVWKRIDYQGTFATSHALIVAATVSSAPLWLDRLAATAGVTKVEAVGAHSCPAMLLTKGVNFLSPGEAGTFVRVSFANSQTYASALNAMNALGFRLAAPAYEQARARNQKPTWHSPGQASTFAQTHTLVLATTELNAVTWATQLKATAGVIKIEAPYKG